MGVVKKKKQKSWFENECDKKMKPIRNIWTDNGGREEKTEKKQEERLIKYAEGRAENLKNAINKNNTRDAYRFVKRLRQQQHERTILKTYWKQKQIVSLKTSRKPATGRNSSLEPPTMNEDQKVFRTIKNAKVLEIDKIRSN